MNEYISDAEELMKTGKYSYALALYYRALNLAEIFDNQSIKIDIMLNIAKIHHDLGSSNLVIEWAELALKEPLEIETKGEFINLLFKNLLFIGNFNQAYSNLQSLIDISGSLFKPTAYTNLGILNLYLSKYLKQYKLDMAEVFLKKALKSVEEDEEKETQIKYYLALNMSEEGLYYSAGEQLADILDSVHNISLKIQILNELGKVKSKLLEYDVAWDYLEEAKELASSCSNQYGLMYNIYCRGIVYLEMFQIENAITHLFTALYDFKKTERYPEISAIYFSLSKLFENQGSEKAKEYFSKYEKYLNKLNYSDQILIKHEENVNVAIK